MKSSQSSHETADKTFRRGKKKTSTLAVAVSNAPGSNLQRALLSNKSNISRNREEIRIENNNTL